MKTKTNKPLELIATFALFAVWLAFWAWVWTALFGIPRWYTAIASLVLWLLLVVAGVRAARDARKTGG